MTVLDQYADDLAELLDEGTTVRISLKEIGLAIDDLDIDLEEVVVHFTEIYEASPEQYAENVKDDVTWSETQTNSS